MGPRQRGIEGDVAVVAGDTTQVPKLNVQLGKPKPHLRKDGTAYPPKTDYSNRR